MSQAVTVPKVRSKPPPEANNWRKDMHSPLAELPAGVTDLAVGTVLIQAKTVLPSARYSLRRLPRWNFVGN